MPEDIAGMPTVEAITAAMEAAGAQESTPPTPPAAPVVAAAPDPDPAIPAPATEEVPPKPLELTDKSVVIDPADGQQKTWGEIKAERLRREDYTRKTMTLAEERKAFAAERAKATADQAVAKAKAALAALPDLPEDDPYAKHIAELRKQNEAVLAIQQQAAEDARLAQEDAARARLDADVARVSAEHKLSEREINFVGTELLRRINSGEAVTLDLVAKEFVDYRTAQQEEAVNAWKEKHRVGSDAAIDVAPAAPAPAVSPLPGAPGFLEAVMAHMGIKT